MASKQFEDNNLQQPGLDINNKMAWEEFKEFKKSKGTIEGFISFLEALYYCDDLEKLIEFEIPFSMN